ncbi:MAG: hypothetical protein WDN45_14580 [Caulobacteraceae bacterium]
MEPAAARKAALALLERLGLSDRVADPGRQAVQGPGPEGPAGHRPGQRAPAGPAGRAVLRPRPGHQGVLEDVIREMAGRGSTVEFSTHVMQHAERLCDRLLLLARGKKVFEGTQDEARAALPPPPHPDRARRSLGPGRRGKATALGSAGEGWDPVRGGAGARRRPGRPAASLPPPRASR